MQTYRLVVEYDGTDFCGFQYQGEVRSVAGELEAVLGRLFDEEIGLAAAGRTDTGVHATGQVVSFRSERVFPIDRLALAANAYLPKDVSVREAGIVEGRFSARFDAFERTYEYLILNRTAPSAVMGRWTHHVFRPIDDDRVRAAAADLVGKHDFAAFCGSRPDTGGTVRNLRSLELEREGEIVRLRLRADGFLHRMVRVTVGTLLEIGTGRREPGDIAALLESQDRRRAGYTAPASGLFLAGVRYDGFDSYARPLVPVSPG